MIYTSYFANYRKFPEGCIAVSIAQCSPESFDHDLTYRHLGRVFAPSPKLIKMYKNGAINDAQYTELYFAELKTKSKDVWNALIVLNEVDATVLCYESKRKFCHRHLLPLFADKYYPMLGIKFKEL